MNDLYDLQLFAGEANTQTTGHGGLSAEMKTYYGMELLENAKPQLVHNQFAATKPLPTGGGKTYAGLRYCLQAAKLRNAKRIFYFAPFRSILGQNAAEFKKMLGGDVLSLIHI